MPAPDDLRATGDRIEHLLDELQSVSEPRSFALAEELLRLVSDLYGAGLGRVVALAEETSPEFLDSMIGDDLVASLLVVLGLHPKSLTVRVADALDEVRPFLASHAGGVELLGVDVDGGVVRLRLLGSCDGCPSSAVTLQMAVERAIAEAAPEIVRIDVDKPSDTVPGVPIALSVKPTYTACPVGVTGT
jgi:Fe-S cluster biogenesis protein NfuA